MSRWPELEGRTALVTGAGRNIGRGIILEYAKCGANVVVNARSNRDEAEAVAAEAEALGVQALVALADVGDHTAVKAMVDQAIAKFGAIDMYVSNAAVRRRQAFLDTTIDDWHQTMNSNLNASFYLAHYIVPGMVERAWGRIVHISGHDGWKGTTHRVHNVTAKAGLHGLTKAMAKELAVHGIRVNTAVAGSFNTTRDPKDYPTWSAAERAKQNPLGRIGEPWEMGAACAFLSSDSAAYINGQAIHLNGGENMY